MVINGLNAMMSSLRAGDCIGGVTGSNLAAQSLHSQFVDADPLTRYAISILRPTGVRKTDTDWDALRAATIGTELGPQNSMSAIMDRMRSPWMASEHAKMGPLNGNLGLVTFIHGTNPSE